MITEKDLTELNNLVANIYKQKHGLVKTNEVLNLYKWAEMLLIDHGYKIVPKKVEKDKSKNLKSFTQLC